MEFTLRQPGAHKFPRLVRPYVTSKGKTLRSRNGIHLFTEEFLPWARAMDRAETGRFQPIDFRAPLAAQPF
jgi:hypothetical protein